MKYDGERLSLANLTQFLLKKVTLSFTKVYWCFRHLNSGTRYPLACPADTLYDCDQCDDDDIDDKDDDASGTKGGKI